jgi:hypothetical protein
MLQFSVEVRLETRIATVDDAYKALAVLSIEGTPPGRTVFHPSV